MCNVYLLCKDGNALMPGTFNGFDDSGLALVLSRDGTEYTCNQSGRNRTFQVLAHIRD